MGSAGRDFWDEYREVVEKQIRQGHEDGAFDDLPGAGRPLRLPADDDEHWWVREKMRREGIPRDPLLPTPLRLRKEIERLPATVRDLPDEHAVRAAAEELDARVLRWIRTPTGPAVAVPRVRVDDVVAAWRAERPTTARPGTPVPATPARRRWWPRRSGRRGPG